MLFTLCVFVFLYLDKRLKKNERHMNFIFVSFLGSFIFRNEEILCLFFNVKKLITFLFHIVRPAKSSESSSIFVDVVVVTNKMLFL